MFFARNKPTRRRLSSAAAPSAAIAAHRLKRIVASRRGQGAFVAAPHPQREQPAPDPLLVRLLQHEAAR